eukprot:TRINITY_DN910_c1_g2_i1.p2 TRINITY_DN910_c1_g2~~TRINITY_DN910_c1_g2_i1.p2  ORF type:complete len:511 (+),score=128.26 TRINITY_DN910_c1_g2_i1:1926-3458(+)
MFLIEPFFKRRANKKKGKKKKSKMVLDIMMFRKEHGGNPDLLRESQRRRCKDAKLVDNVIAIDKEWRIVLKKAETLQKTSSKCSKLYGMGKKAKKPDGEDLPIPEEMKSKVLELTDEDLSALNGSQLKKFATEINQQIALEKEKQKQLEQRRHEAIKLVGNIVHESCEPTDDEEHNEVIRKWGELPEKKEDTFNHVDLMELLGMDRTENTTMIAGSRSYVLKGDLVRLQLALINYSMNFLIQKGSTPLYPPFFMTKDMMGNVAELADFDEALYHVGDGSDSDKYLIATSEQPICAYQAGRWYQEADLKEPIKYAGYSTCFRKEAGSSGKDTLGIFRVHQFEKIEQFVVCSPRNGESWKMLDELINNSEEFYQSLGLPYRVVQIVAGALNLAAAKKYDLEAYFPASETFRELVSVSNCTDYQSRAIETRFGQSLKTSTSKHKEYVHMLNGTLCAITRTMCCIVENYQTEEGIKVPKVLQPYMGGTELLRFNGPKVRTNTLEDGKKRKKQQA